MRGNREEERDAGCGGGDAPEVAREHKSHRREEGERGTAGEQVEQRHYVSDERQSI